MAEDKNANDRPDKEVLAPAVPEDVYVEQPENGGEQKKENNNDGKPAGEWGADEIAAVTGKVQDHGYRNGEPEVKKGEKFNGSETPEVQNNEALRENKGSKPGEEVFEASEEVETGQSGG